MQTTTTNSTNDNLRIVFMGTPDFAAFILQQMINSQYSIAGVVTVADKAAGRGKKLRQSPVKELALKEGLPLLQPTNLKDESFISSLEALKADVFVVVAFRMLPKQVWSIPSKGCFNLHASLLPDYRGAAPINWAIINGEEKTGVTTFFIDEQIDTGAIIDQRELTIDPDEYVGSLHDRLMHLGADLVCNTLDQIKDGIIQTRAQETYNPKAAPKLFKENCKIDWNQTSSNIYNKIRGLSPYPVAWSLLDDQGQQSSIKIYEASPHLEDHNLSPGSIVRNKKELKVATTDGFIALHSIQLPNKKRLNVHSLLNGLKWTEEAKFL